MGKGKKRASKDARILSSNDPHAIAFFKRHVKDDPKQSAPGYEFLSACPVKVEATIYAVLKAVAAAPPKRYAGGGYWEAMHGAMTGWFEVRVDGSNPEPTIGCFAGSITTLKVRTAHCWSPLPG